MSESATPVTPPVSAGAAVGAFAATGAVAAALLIPLPTEDLPDWARFGGRLHPMVLHVPIGLLLGAAGVEALGWFRRGLAPAVAVLLWLAALSSVVAVAAGLLLEAEGGYGEILVWHRWLGGATAALTFWLIALRPRGGPAAAGVGRNLVYHAFFAVQLAALTGAGHYGASLTHGAGYLEEYWPFGSDTPANPADDNEAGDDVVAESEHVLAYRGQVEPLVTEFCFRCHNENKQKGDIRLDNLNPDFVAGGNAEGWHAALDMINGGEMPPSSAPQMTDEQRRAVVAWMQEGLELATAEAEPERAVLRRLTRAQYTNTLQDLLGLGVDFGSVLPADGKSEIGFSNNGAVLQATPLHLDYYQSVARAALEQAIPVERPQPTRYLVTFGKGVGKGLTAGRTGGYQSVPLGQDDFTVEVLDVEGIVRQGSDEAEKQALDAIRRRISVGLRGSAQDRFRMLDDGLLLFAAFPRKEKAPAAWQGPSPNVKLEMQRVFARQGDFVLRVKASRGEIPVTQEQMLLAAEEGAVPFASLDEAGAVVVPEGSVHLRAAKSDQRKNVDLVDGFLAAKDVPKDASARLRVNVASDGFYQFDVVHRAGSADAMPSLRWKALRRHIDLRPAPEAGVDPKTPVVTPLGIAVLRAGRHHFNLGGKFFAGFRDVVITPLGQDHPVVQRLSAKVEERNAAVAHLVPELRTFVGTRTDDGMDYKSFGPTLKVEARRGEPATYTFHGRLENLPIPEPESGDTEVLSGFMVLGLWNHHLVKSRGETGPPVLVRSMEFEAPYFEAWPPRSQTDILGVADTSLPEEERTQVILEQFMARAFRRPVSSEEVARYLDFWQAARPEFDRYEDSIKEVLVAVLCSPGFLFLAEPQPEETQPEEAQRDGLLGEHALATRLSYFLWNSPPDAELIGLADQGQLRAGLLDQVDRMLDDPRTWRFVEAFATEWLRLDRHEGMTINVDVHPDFTRFVKDDMRSETLHFVHHVIASDRSVLDFLDSDYALLNQNLAEFYGVPGVMGSEFRPVPVRPEQHRGGLLSQGAFLAGHSDGTRPHAIKRAVWLKERILGDAPPPPPPNVPELDPETPGFEKMTLKQQMEIHRSNPSCTDCHLSIDPYGVPFQQMSAVGRFETKRRDVVVDATEIFPDGTPVNGVRELQDYLLSVKRDAFAEALIEHVFAYALGRDVHFADEKELDRILGQVKLGGYRMRTLLRAIVASPSFKGR